MEMTILFIAVVFVIAGAVKGAIGLGLPPITMGLLVMVMPPVEAAALTVAPAFVTNVWQMVDGPHLRRLVRRLWPLMLCAVAGTLAGAGWLTAENARTGTAILGAVLALYALSGLVSVQYTAGKRTQKWLGPVTGGLTGLVTAATGVSSMPVVPYFQSIGLEKDALVQAMGLSFTVSTLALSANLAAVNALSWSLGQAAGIALAAVLTGLWLGQTFRKRLNPAAFRLWFLSGLLVLGFYLFVRSVI